MRKNIIATLPVRDIGFDSEPIVISSLMTSSHRNMTCDLCKISLWQVEHILNQSTTNFDRISNSIEIASGTGAWPFSSKGNTPLCILFNYLYLNFILVYKIVSYVLLPMVVAGVINWPKYFIVVNAPPTYDVLTVSKWERDHILHSQVIIQVGIPNGKFSRDSNPFALRALIKTQSFGNAMVTEISFISSFGGDILFFWIICYIFRPHWYWHVPNIIMMIETLYQTVSCCFWKFTKRTSIEKYSCKPKPHNIYTSMYSRLSIPVTHNPGPYVVSRVPYTSHNH